MSMAELQNVLTSDDCLGKRGPFSLSCGEQRALTPGEDGLDGDIEQRTSQLAGASRMTTSSGSETLRSKRSKRLSIPRAGRGLVWVE